MAGTLHSAPLGLPATLPLSDVNALAFVDQFDVVLCELPATPLRAGGRRFA